MLQEEWSRTWWFYLVGYLEQLPLTDDVFTAVLQVALLCRYSLSSLSQNRPLQQI